MAVRVDGSLDGIDWAQAKADLAADDFDNGRSPCALRASFEHSQHVAIARDGDQVVGMAWLLSEGVCNAYLLDVWTMSAYRRRGIGTAMVRQLMSRVPGQHVGLQTDNAEAFMRPWGTVTSRCSCQPWWANGSSTNRMQGYGPVQHQGAATASTCA
jgi:GNAT superfamily N-acetyltransferase